MRALSSNSAYLESEDGISTRNKLIDDINQRFDEAIETVRDPGKHERQMRAIREDPLMSASLRAMDRMRWDLASGIDPLSR